MGKEAVLCLEGGGKPAKRSVEEGGRPLPPGCLLPSEFLMLGWARPCI